MRRSIWFSLIFLFVLSAQPASGAIVRSHVSKEGKTIISINGEIVPEDVLLIKDAIKTANAANRLVSGFRLNSQGGNLAAGAEIAEIVRFSKAATVVANGSTCASACFLIFAAGNEKFASHSAQIGVHGASDQSGKETIRSNAATVSMARMAKELGVSETIIGKMVVTPPHQMVWLSANDLRSIGTTMTGKPVQIKEDNAPSIANLPIDLSPTGRSAAPSQLPVERRTEKPSWDEMIEKAAAASASQNNGKPRLLRSCQPEMKVCQTGIYIEGKDGRDMLLRRTEDMNGKTLKRDFCTFNQFGDVRTCLNWDNGSTVRSMKNAKGDWYNVDED